MSLTDPTPAVEPHGDARYTPDGFDALENDVFVQLGGEKEREKLERTARRAAAAGQVWREPLPGTVDAQRLTQWRNAIEGRLRDELRGATKNINDKYLNPIALRLFRTHPTSEWPRLERALIEDCDANGYNARHRPGSALATINSARRKAIEDGPSWPGERAWTEPVPGHLSTEVETKLGKPETGRQPPAFEVPRLWRALDLKPAQRPEWLARQRLPLAAVSLLIGAEGIGKSLFWVLIVFAVSTGKPLPALGIPAREPKRIVLVLTEDDWSTEVRPRLEVVGADLNMIQVICTEPDGSGAPVFPRDMDIVREAAPYLVVVDAWLDTVPGRLSIRDTQQAREALHPWKETATATGAAVLLVCHTNRVSSADTRDTYGGTIGLRQKARMALYGLQDDDGRLVIGPDKANGVAAVRASVFQIKGVPHFEPADDHDGTVPKLDYVAESDRTIKEHVLGAFEAGHGDDPQERTDAQMWLSDYLQQEGPGASSAEAKRSARAAGISDKALRNAREKLNVVVSYSGFPKRSVWSLPDTSDDAGQWSQQ